MALEGHVRSWSCRGENFLYFFEGSLLGRMVRDEHGVRVGSYSIGMV